MKLAFALCFAIASLAAQDAPPAPPLTLRALFDSIASTHPLIRAAASHAQAAKSARITAGAFSNPLFNFQSDRAASSGASATMADDREIMTTATIPLEPLYQRWSRVQSADAAVRAADADADLTRQQVGLDAAAAYYRTAQAQLEVADAHDLSAWLDTLVAYNRSRVGEGAAAGVDLLRAELERDRVATDATMREVELARARAALSAFLGNPRARAVLTVATSDRPLSLADFAAVQSQATPMLDQRPDVRAARGRADASRAAAATERTMIVRQVGATIGTQRMAGTTSVVLGVALPLPLFDSDRGEIGRASAERDAAAFELVATERNASADLLGAREAARLLTARAELLTTRGADGFLARADEARRIALGAYREGAVPLLTVLNAARAWGEARATFYRTLYAQHQSILALLVAEGANLFAKPPAPAESDATNR